MTTTQFEAVIASGLRGRVRDAFDTMKGAERPTELQAGIFYTRG